MAYGGLGVLIRQTRRFINDNPVDVRIMRSPRTPDGAGGTLTDEEVEVSEDTDTIRIVPTGLMNQVEIRTVDGEVVKSGYSILAMPDIDLKDGDSFMFEGNRYEVASVVQIGGYEMRAEAVRRG
jgi:hypothetical protein